MFEQAVYNYTGLSTDEKPTLAAEVVVPNGSRWREIDTGKVFHYFSTLDAWHETGNVTMLIADNNPVVDLRALEVFEQILTTLKKIEYHLSIASDVDLKDHDV